MYWLRCISSRHVHGLDDDLASNGSYAIVQYSIDCCCKYKNQVWINLPRGINTYEIEFSLLLIFEILIFDTDDNWNFDIWYWQTRNFDILPKQILIFDTTRFENLIFDTGPPLGGPYNMLKAEPWKASSWVTISGFLNQPPASTLLIMLIWVWQ